MDGETQDVTPFIFFHVAHCITPGVTLYMSKGIELYFCTLLSVIRIHHFSDLELVSLIFSIYTMFYNYFILYINVYMFLCYMVSD